MISGMLVCPQLHKEAIFLINSNKKAARLYVHLVSSWYISFVPLQLVRPDFLRRPRSIGKRESYVRYRR